MIYKNIMGSMPFEKRNPSPKIIEYLKEGNLI